MATEKTLAIKHIGMKQFTFHVKQPWKPSPTKVTRLVEAHKIGRVVHAGGTRIGAFK